MTSFKADLAAELQETLVLTENGKQRRVTKQRAFVKTLTAAAIKKDIRAVTALLACMRFFGVGAEDKKLYVNFIVCYLEQFMRGDIKRLLVNLPGRHLKTFMCSVCLPAFMLGTDPTLKFLIVAHNEELAEDIVRQVREIMQSPWYRAVFKTRLDPRHSKKDDFKIIGGGRVRAAPVRSVTGIGGDIVIFDDPHNVYDWDNDAKKANVIEAFELLVSRRDADPVPDARGGTSRMTCPHILSATTSTTFVCRYSRRRT